MRISQVMWAVFSYSNGLSFEDISPAIPISINELKMV